MIIIIVLLFMIDQKTKTLAIKHLKHKGKRKKGIFTLLYVENRGGAMGFLKKYPTLLKILHISTLIFLTYIFFQEKKASNLKAFAYLLIISGGLGNLYDRLKRKYVVDFFSIKYKKIPYFNLADIYVFVGLFMTILFAF